MKAKAIIPCPMKFMDAGVENLMDAAVLVHVGRCGLQGCTLASISDAVKKRGKALSLSTCDCVTRRLHAAGWITRFTRSNTTGKAYWWVVTVKGWDLLTRAPVVGMFPDAMKMPMR